MAKLPVHKYAAEWQPSTNQGKIFVQIGSADFVPVPIDNADEFVVMLLMLGKSGVRFDNVTREIEVPPRPVGS